VELCITAVRFLFLMQNVKRLLWN